MKTLLTLSVSVAALLVASSADAASLLNCGTGPRDVHNCPVGPEGPQGPQGEKGDTGAQGPQGEQGAQGEKGDKGDAGETGATGAQGVAGNDGKDGANGKDGVDGKNGTNGLNGRDGRDFDSADALAMSAALSPPVWLGDTERVRISTGVGFTDSAAAVGATGVVRIDGALAGFAGGAVSTETGAWAAKAGLSYGW